MEILQFPMHILQPKVHFSSGCVRIDDGHSSKHMWKILDFFGDTK